ncbi:addiction module toxin RelE [Helicobacter pylori]|nr:addiction module toxin RelE [Helicobacter pylori]
MSGNLKGLRECHVKPNLLLIYEIKKQENELVLLRLDTHSELFKKVIKQYARKLIHTTIRTKF